MLWRGLLFDWAIYVAACFMLRGRDTHIDFLWFFFLVDMIDDLPSDASSIFFYLF